MSLDSLVWPQDPQAVFRYSAEWNIIAAGVFRSLGEYLGEPISHEDFSDPANSGFSYDIWSGAPAGGRLLSLGKESWGAILLSIALGR